ncbi:NnrU family protein [Palleronia sp. LCG004]|uniref:NnrU family protein n=1 Tax=Palleronia sp. LCG004 TaxID=3079304 RepID=UPI0029421B37|nr:NnrU family protein [Palleronia sp. LCG004]WOI56907.1 NnrU family protein [Palleronia sp. LCG004]
MALLIAGLALWIAAHLFKGVAPGPRAEMTARMGSASKGIFAILLVLSVVLMVMGYRAAAFVPVWSPPQWGVHVVDLGMIFAIGLFALGHSKSPLRGRIRHPQLWGFALWAALHLLVNGDLASLVLWGTLLVWALMEMPIINARDGAWEPYRGGTTAGTIRLVVIAIVVYLVVAGIHAWLGVWPFPR